jgi:hypothetical protein
MFNVHCIKYSADSLSVIQPFEIVNDLNMNPVLRKPFGVSNDKRVGILCWNDGVINTFFGVEKSNKCLF